ncbi:MAG: hypothetical protein ACXVEF_05870 [Polyangiales bacterium]
MFRSLFLFVMVGCSSSSQPSAIASDAGDVGVDTSEPACVVYDGPASDGVLPFDDSTASTISPTCAHRCDAKRDIGGFFEPAGLPSGSCTSELECDMAITMRCSCPDERGPTNGVHCRCQSGTWHCAIESQGGAICVNACLDAGPGGG